MITIVTGAGKLLQRGFWLSHRVRSYDLGFLVFYCSGFDYQDKFQFGPRDFFLVIL